MRENKFFLKNAESNFNFENLMSQAKAIEDMCEDFYVRNISKNMFVRNDGKLTFSEDGITSKTREFTQTSLAQMSQKLNIPTTYAEKCAYAGKTDLLARNMNSWLHDIPDGTGVMLRGYGEFARAIVSTRFSPYDSFDVLDNISKNLDMTGLKINQYVLNEERLQLRMIGDKLSIDGEDLFSGLIISSSDVGTGSLSVNFYIWKQVCSNGLVLAQLGGKLLHQRHMGISADEFSSSLTAASEHYLDFVGVAEDLIRNNRSEFLDEHQMDLLLAKIAKEANVPKKVRDNIVELASTRYAKDAAHISRWDIVNGITEVAQKYELGRRTELETFAGRLLVA